jgi:tRNA(Ile)-lysidine synthase
MGSINIVGPCDRTATLAFVSSPRDAQFLTSPGASAGSDSPVFHRLNRRSPAVAVILKDWRRLTSPAGARRAAPGAPTLVACSGGADSGALVLALACSGARIVVAHVVHDLREPALALADRDAVRALAGALGLEFLEASVHVAVPPGNAESNARRARYRALAVLARHARTPFIATAHHADDQLESMLMAIVRGSGPAGLAGVAASRPISLEADAAHGPWRARLVRPMLAVTRADAEAICREAGYQPRIDHTNTDTSRLRAALRATVTPALRALRPQAPVKSAQGAALLADAARLLRARARRHLRTATPVDGGGITLARRRLAPLSDGVLGEVLRLGAARLAGAGADRRSSRSLRAVIRAIRDHDGSPRRFTFGGVALVLDASSLTLFPAPCPEPPSADRRARPDRAR